MAGKRTAPDKKKKPKRMTVVGETYNGDDPIALANEIEQALMRFAVGDALRHCGSITFFEGELALIAKSLRNIRS